MVTNEHQGADVETAVSALLRGELALLPTETVYGLACDAGNPRAVGRVFEAKGRPQFNPLIAHVTGLDAALAFADLDARARRLAEAFWPGPLTLVAPIHDTAAVCDLARAGLDTVAVRAPDHPVAQAVLAALGRPVAAPSANRSGRPSPTTHADAVEETGAFAAASLDGGPCRVGLESTVLGQAGGQLVLLRPGAVTREAIEEIVGPIAAGLGEGKGSPGRLARHYAPSKPLRLEVSDPSPGAGPKASQAAHLQPQLLGRSRRSGGQPLRLPAGRRPIRCPDDRGRPDPLGRPGRGDQRPAPARRGAHRLTAARSWRASC